MESFKQLRGQWDRAAAAVLTLLGVLLLIIGWFGVAGKGITSEQMPYIISGGLGGIFLMGVGAALWLSADLRDEWIKLDRIETVLEDGLTKLGLGRGRDDKPVLAPLEAPRGPSALSASDVTADNPAVTQSSARTHTTRASATPAIARRNANGVRTSKAKAGTTGDAL
ncbi:MAG: hypothetical protein QOE58_3406 [Actinomycetota bacterium]|nr:hypothetical protein [Actinomycetota bacterium]